MITKYLFFTCLIVSCYSTYSQFNYPSLSPKGEISQVVGNTKIKVEYERPSVRDRKIFGALVPWNKVWRTGAGRRTRISFDKPVKIGRQTLDAGRYSLFTIPNPDKWIIILSADTAEYGSTDYDIKKDVVRFVSFPKTTQRHYEALTIDIDIVPNNAKIYISWENIQISFDVQTTADEEMLNYINQYLLTKKEKDSDIYAGAADHLSYQNHNFRDAIKLADIAIQLDKNNGWARRIKMDVYEKLHMYSDALIVLSQAIEYESNKEEIQYWEKHVERIKKKQENQF